MSNQTLLDNIKRLQTWDLAYLTSRLLDWKAKHTSVCKTGCTISKTTDSNGYATITLCRSSTSSSKQDKWHVRAYTLEAFVLKQLPSIEALEKVKHPVASHLCGRGAFGCSTLSHIAFGEPQKVNKDRDTKRCVMPVHCPSCKSDFFSTCPGHGDAVPVCMPPLVAPKPKKQRLQEISSLIIQLQEERETLLLSKDQ